MSVSTGGLGSGLGGRSGGSAVAEIIDGTRRNNPDTGNPEQWNADTNSWDPDTASAGGSLTVGTLRSVGGNVERWDGSAWGPYTLPTSTTSTVVEQAGAPSAAPDDRTQTSLIQDTLTDTLWSWDVQDQVWRSVGLVADQAALASLPANIWTNFPTFSLLNTVESWEIYDASRNRLTLLETRRRSDGWPQVRSLNAYTNLSFEANGYGLITV